MQEKPEHRVEQRELGYCVYCAAETKDFCPACEEYVCAECYPSSHKAPHMAK